MIFEDDDLLVVNKPAGINTHAAAPYASEGLFDWLRNREPRWAKLAIIHRLDKETSGVLVFAKSRQANRSLTQQFTNRTVQKVYLLLTDRPVPERELRVRSNLVRVGEKYVSRRAGAKGEEAETVFKLQAPSTKHQRSTKNQAPGLGPTSESLCDLDVGASLELGAWCLELSSREPGSLHIMTAEPLTGRTHQIRVHAADKGFPILGDTLYCGTPAARVYLHAARITFTHPTTGDEVSFSAPVNFSEDSRLALRRALIEEDLTDAFRLIHGASDGWPRWYVERLGPYLLSQGESELETRQQEKLKLLLNQFSVQGSYHKMLTQQVRRIQRAEASPRLVLGDAAPERFTVRENGMQFELSFAEGYSVGLFLDQRDNRRRLLTGNIGPGFSLSERSPSSSSSSSDEEAGRKKNEEENENEEEKDNPALLNTFAYTCGFSVCAAKAGFRTVSLDLSRKYLDWGRRNFVLNQIDPSAHDFIYGDVFDWLPRLVKKKRSFDVVLLDPPTFSQSKDSGVFQAEKHYAKLVRLALPLVKPGGVLFASTNAATWAAENFIEVLEHAVHESGRKILKRHFAPQPPDFPVSREEPAYLKTAWLRIKDLTS